MVLHGAVFFSGAAAYRFDWPRAIFFILRFFSPRAWVRGAFGLAVFAFLRAARFSFLRSALFSIFVVFIRFLNQVRAPCAAISVLVQCIRQRFFCHAEERTRRSIPSALIAPSRLLQLREFLDKLLHPVPRELHRDLGFIALTFAPHNRAFTVLWMDDAGSRLETFLAGWFR